VAASFIITFAPLGITLPQVTVGLVLLSLPIAAAVAILKYRLYDVDVVINKTVVYGALAAFITAIYVSIVVGVGSVVGQGDQPNVALSIIATAIVAVAFQPVRARVQRLANRLVYGDRATPYEVLARFSERAAGTYATDDVLDRTARVIAEGTGAELAAVWLRVGNRLRRAAAWPSDPATAEAELPLDEGESVPDVPGADRLVEVRHRGELLGAITVTKARGEPPTPAEDKLIADLASQAGLVLHNAGLMEELRAGLERLSAQATELRASRQRIVAAHDAERRRLERNIHDGAQQHLVALAVRLRLAKSLARKDPNGARTMLGELQTETLDAVRTLQDLASGIYPPVLEEHGIAAALEAQAKVGGSAVRVEANGIARLPIETEAAVYFCCLEAIQNAAKYANAPSILVRLGREGDDLTFSVTDDGAGFDPETTPSGSGLRNMEDRASSLGGSVHVRSAPGKGTTVAGRIPVSAVEVVT
jgi:signal transduction histidine kinase